MDVFFIFFILMCCRLEDEGSGTVTIRVAFRIVGMSFFFFLFYFKCSIHTQYVEVCEVPSGVCWRQEPQAKDQRRGRWQVLFQSLRSVQAHQESV